MAQVSPTGYSVRKRENGCPCEEPCDFSPDFAQLLQALFAYQSPG